MEHRRISVGPKEILHLNKPTNGFLCDLSANIQGIEFLSFVITDYNTKRVLFEIGKDEQLNGGLMELDYDVKNEEDCCRAVKYTFSEDVLRLPLVGTRLKFKVGSEPLSNFRMIERHYFQNQLIKSYDFTFGFCIPGSVNTWDAIYDVPPLQEDLIQQMMAHPYETTSDTFYFVENELVMHNKARYKYIDGDVSRRRNSRYQNIDVRREQQHGTFGFPSEEEVGNSAMENLALK